MEKGCASRAFTTQKRSPDGHYGSTGATAGRPRWPTKRESGHGYAVLLMLIPSNVHTAASGRGIRPRRRGDGRDHGAEPPAEPLGLAGHASAGAVRLTWETPTGARDLMTSENYLRHRSFLPCCSFSSGAGHA